MGPPGCFPRFCPAPHPFEPSGTVVNLSYPLISSPIRFPIPAFVRFCPPLFALMATGLRMGGMVADSLSGGYCVVCAVCWALREARGRWERIEHEPDDR
jgi:hypothetical protein